MAKAAYTRGERLDQYVVACHPLLSRAYASRLITEEKVTVNGRPEKPGYRLRPEDVVVVDFDDTSLNQIPAIELPVLYEDESVLVVNKPAGVISHARGRYWDEPSVASFVRQKISSELADRPEDQALRAGIVHRLDRATSGVMICAKTPAALAWLQKQFAARSVVKTYHAVIAGELNPPAAIIDMPIERNPKAPATFRVGSQGKPAQTQYRTISTGGGYSLLELLPKTGRTHQLRVHLAARSHPIVGDALYGGQSAERLLLHASSLEITLPGKQERRLFSAPLPDDFGRPMALHGQGAIPIDNDSREKADGLA